MRNVIIVITNFDSFFEDLEFLRIKNLKHASILHEGAASAAEDERSRSSAHEPDTKLFLLHCNNIFHTNLIRMSSFVSYYCCFFLTGIHQLTESVTHSSHVLGTRLHHGVASDGSHRLLVLDGSSLAHLPLHRNRNRCL